MLNPKKYIAAIIFFSIVACCVAPASNAASAKDSYFKAEACYKSLRNNPKRQKYRSNWLACINKFEDVYQSDPSGPWAAAGLYMSGKLYVELYKRSYRASDKAKAIDAFERLINRFPNSHYREKAQDELKNIKGDIKNSRPSNTSATVKKPAAKNRNSKKTAVNPNATVNYLRYSTYPDFTRIVVETDKETLYTYGFLKKDPKLKTPMRMYVDIHNSRLCDRLKTKLPEIENHLSYSINKNLDLRISQNQPDVVRVVIYNYYYNDVEFKPKNYEVKEYFDPFRIVIDINGKATKIENSDRESEKDVVHGTKKHLEYAVEKDEATPSPGALAKQFSLGVKRIVIDPGHGGKDYGAPGYLKGVHEKDIVLKLAKKLAVKIEKQLNCEVILTRKSDYFLTLEERTRIANQKKADLFISLHTNASRNRNAYGIETYFLNLATDNEAINVAATENATSTKNISDLQDILTDLMRNAKINESSRLAGHVQYTLYNNTKKKYGDIKNKGVKQAPFYVLLGAKMPAILIETSFISNPRECKRLTTDDYLDRLCDSILDGIKSYITETHPVAHMEETTG